MSGFRHYFRSNSRGRFNSWSPGLHLRLVAFRLLISTRVLVATSHELPSRCIFSYDFRNFPVTARVTARMLDSAVIYQGCRSTFWKIQSEARIPQVTTPSQLRRFGGRKHSHSLKSNSTWHCHISLDFKRLQNQRIDTAAFKPPFFRAEVLT